LPQNPPMGSFENAFHSCGANVDPMACSLSSTLGSSILDEWESQIIHGVRMWKTQECW